MALLLLSFGLMASMSSSVRVRQSKLVDNADASHLTALPREATCMFGKLGPAKLGISALMLKKIAMLIGSTPRL